MHESAGERTPDRLRAARRLPLTGTLVALLVLAEIVGAALPEGRFDRLVAWASTNVDRLTSEPVLPMLVSPFVVGDYLSLWPPVLAFGLAVSELRVRWARTLLLVVTGHVVGTLVSEGIVWWRVAHGRLPDSARTQSDVGISYVAVASLAGALVLARHWWTRLMAVAVLVVIGPTLLDGLSDLAVSAVGHLTAFGVAGIGAVILVVTVDASDAGCRRRRGRRWWFR